MPLALHETRPLLSKSDLGCLGEQMAGFLFDSKLALMIIALAKKIFRLGEDLALP